MIVTETEISGLLVIEPKVFSDERGFFFESFNQHMFQKATGLDINFVQDNHSKSKKGVLRGLHFQIPSKTQSKLVRVVNGEIFDVAVDLRKSSNTFGRWVGQVLSAENKKQLWIPFGFAHGFMTLSDTAEILYKTTDYYSPELERCISWNDPDIAIQWPSNMAPILSEKDQVGASFNMNSQFAGF